MNRHHFLILLLALPFTDCSILRHEKAQNYETISAELQGDTKTAAEKNRKAILQLEKGNCDKAKALVEQALIADVNHAPSHNTLGRIHYQLNDYYLAAWEFEFALKILPNTPEYHNNLGLVYEAADRLEEASLQYTNAIELEPQNYNFVSNYACVRIRKGEVNEETRDLLDQVVFLDPRPQRKDWARQQLTQSHLNIPRQEPIEIQPESMEIYPEESTALGVPELPPQRPASPVIPDLHFPAKPELETEEVPEFDWQPIPDRTEWTPQQKKPRTARIANQ